ncbi:ABC transporter substrate-binding protein [Gammaproteobacteria bacterium 45_16_T64]|nr:ABC transporter substrate-binding protein [Gammaproteobacteria bacterium 45_16_T64]
MNVLSAVLLAVTLFSLSPTLWAQGNDDNRLVITGSSTVAPLMSEIAKRFERQHPGTRVDVQTGGSSRGIADARSGRADIGMASRAKKSSEFELLFHTVALDGIAIIVNKNNPLNTLTDEQIRLVFTGDIGNWKVLGGSDRAITVVNKAEGRSTLELFLQYMKLKNSEVAASIIIGDNQQGIKTVAGNEHAIGYVSIGAAEFEAGYGTPIKLLPMGGVAASVDSVKNRRFPLARPLNLVTKQDPVGLVKKFIAFAQSDSVHDLITDNYFVAIPAQTVAENGLGGGQAK